MAQNKSHYSLLWKISGKGMAKPSFLFGTMHVEDRRVFNFSDSVMLALQSCPRFALEVQPDSAISKVLQLASGANMDQLKKMFTDEQLKKLEQKYKAKGGQSLDDANPIALDVVLNPKERHADDMQSFIDAYLYGIARTLNKKIYGLEDPGPQIDRYFASPEALKMRLLGALDDDAELYQKRSREEMVKIYSSGDINKVYDYLKGTPLVDSVILARNQVMASSIIKNMQEEPIFSAVGAAHLPGPGGVIDLLQKAGYTVTPVKATFTGVAATFHVDYLKVDWVKFTDAAKGYEVSFPGNPLPVKVAGEPYEMYGDIANELYYGAYAVHKGIPSQPMTPAAAFASTVDFFKTIKRDSIISKKEFDYQGYPAAELMMKAMTQYIRMRLVFANNLMYHFYVSSVSDKLDQPAISRFFNSVAISRIAEKAAAPWTVYTDKQGAFTASFPFPPDIKQVKEPAQSGDDSVNYILNNYTSDDTLNSRSYLLQYYDYPAGTYLADKKAMMDAYISQFTEKGTLIGKTEDITNNGVPGRAAAFVTNGGFSLNLRVFARGNRVYLLMKEITQSGLKDNRPADPFFDTFRLLPYQEAGVYTWQPPNANFKVQMPAEPVVKPQKNDQYNTYITETLRGFSNNPNSGALYFMDCLKISPYYRAANIDTIFKDKIAAYTGGRDSLLKLDTIKVNGIAGRELLIMDTASKEKRRIRMFIDGENYFYLSVRTGQTELYNKTTEAFFNSLTLTAPSAPVDLPSSKAQKIADDLRSADTLVVKKALGALSFYDFKPAEIHYLYEVVKHDMPDDTSIAGVRISVIRKLRAIGNDTTQDFLAGLYPQIKGRDDVKASMLNAIALLDSKRGYDIYLNYLKNDPPLKPSIPYQVFSPLIDSTEYAAKHFAELLPFLKNELYRGRVLNIAANIVEDKKLANNTAVAGNYGLLMAKAGADLNGYLKEADSADNEYRFNIYEYLRLMKHLKHPEFTAKFTSKYLKGDPTGNYVDDAVIARIYNGLPNKPAIVKLLLDSASVRYEMMKAYYAQKQAAMVPARYRKPSEFAKLCLYDYISENGDGDEDQPAVALSDITLLGTVSEAGKLYYTFSFKYGSDDQSTNCIGIAGPYQPGSTKLNFDGYHAYTGFDKLEAGWRTQAQKLIKPLTDANAGTPVR